MRSAGKVLAWLLPALQLAVAPARADLAFDLDLGDLAGADWSARALTLRLQLRDAAAGSAQIRIEQMVLPATTGVLRGLTLHCPELRHGDDGWSCAAGRLEVAASPLGAQQGTWSGRFANAADWRLSLNGLRLAGGSAALNAQGDPQGWRLDLQTAGQEPQALAGALPVLGLPTDWQLTGRLRSRLVLRGATAGPQAGPQELRAELGFENLGYGSPDGLQAAEGLTGRCKVDLDATAGGWRGQSRLDWTGGQLYAEPLFLEIRDTPVVAEGQGAWQTASGRLDLASWSVRQAGVVDAAGSARLDTAPLSLQTFTAAVQVDDLGRLYGRLLQPYLIGTPGDDLQVQGAGRLEARADADGLQALQLRLTALDLSDRQGRFGLSGVGGVLRWSRVAGEAEPSQLHVDSARVFRIESGGFDLSAQAQDDGLRLLRPLVIPVLGGRLRLDGLELAGLSGAQLSWQADAAVEAVSLEALTRDLDWPPFSGSLSGELPAMAYADGTLRAGGGLRVSAFGGTVAVRDLQVRDPLGVAPVLEGAADLRGLDLEALTRTFSFGRIEGRLDGELRDLQLVAWQPNRFRLRLFTPPEDDARRRISQRAVENLTELGSGVPAGLSATFLRLFEDFSYDRIEVSIALSGDTAELDGIARPDGGYYLVRGAGLPRIDVIGRNRRVAWKDLVERLKRIQVEGAQIR